MDKSIEKVLFRVTGIMVPALIIAPVLSPKKDDHIEISDHTPQNLRALYVSGSDSSIFGGYYLNN